MTLEAVSADNQPVEAPWDEYRARLVVFARMFGGPVARAPEDAAHEIIRKAMDRAETFDGVHSFATWLYRIARNHCIDANRSGARRRAIMNLAGPELFEQARRPAQPDAELERSETALAVAAAVDRLRPRDRRLVFLRFYEDLRLAEIAEILGMPVGSVKYRLHVTMKRLRQSLGEYAEVAT